MRETWELLPHHFTAAQPETFLKSQRRKGRVCNEGAFIPQAASQLTTRRTRSCVHSGRSTAGCLAVASPWMSHRRTRRSGLPGGAKKQATSGLFAVQSALLPTSQDPLPCQVDGHPAAVDRHRHKPSVGASGAGVELGFLLGRPARRQASPVFGKPDRNQRTAGVGSGCWRQSFARPHPGAEMAATGCPVTPDQVIS